MIHALRYEVARIRTIRSTWWISIGALVIGVGITTLFAAAAAHEFGKHAPTAKDLDGIGSGLVTQLAVFSPTPSIVSFLLAIVGILGWGHEYRHGMIRASLTALNSRTAFWLAKYAVVGVWVAGVALATMLLAGVSGMFFLSDYVTVFDAQTWGTIGKEVVYVVLLTWLAMAFTAVTRSQAFGLVAIFLWPFVVEPLLSGFFLLVPGLRDHTEVLRFLPFNAGRQLLDIVHASHSTFGDPLSALGGAVIFAVLAAVLMAASYTLFSRRDA